MEVLPYAGLHGVRECVATTDDSSRPAKQPRTDGPHAYPAGRSTPKAAGTAKRQNEPVVDLTALLAATDDTTMETICELLNSGQPPRTNKYPVTPMVAHIMMLARAVGAADRSTTEKRRRGSSRWMSGRACVCLYGYTRKSIGSKRQAKCGMERAVATVGCRVKAIAKGVAACVSCEHACTGLLHA